MNDPAEIRKDIEQARNELGETVAAVAEKTDVKQQAQATAEDLKERARATVEEYPVPFAVIAILLVLFMLRRLRSR